MLWHSPTALLFKEGKCLSTQVVGSKGLRRSVTFWCCSNININGANEHVAQVNLYCSATQQPDALAAGNAGSSRYHECR